MSMNGCLCSDPSCHMHGCKVQRARAQGEWWPPGMTYASLGKGYGAPIVQGCICPVGAEQFCKGETCPRRERKHSGPA